MFYCVANMPGAVPHTSTYALTNVTLPYAMALADTGLAAALRRRPGAGPGAELARRRGSYAPVAEAHGMPPSPLASEVLA